jgi:hypothetical protein
LRSSRGRIGGGAGYRGGPSRSGGARRKKRLPLGPDRRSARMNHGHRGWPIAPTSASTAFGPGQARLSRRARRPQMTDDVVVGHVAGRRGGALIDVEKTARPSRRSRAGTDRRGTRFDPASAGCPAAFFQRPAPTPRLAPSSQPVDRSKRLAPMREAGPRRRSTQAAGCVVRW